MLRRRTLVAFVDVRLVDTEVPATTDDSTPVVLRRDFDGILRVDRLSSDFALDGAVDDELIARTIDDGNSSGTTGLQGVVRTREHLTAEASIDEEAQVKASEGEAVRKTSQEIGLLVTELLLIACDRQTVLVGDDLTIEVARLVLDALVA